MSYHDWDKKLDPPDIHEEDSCGLCHDAHLETNRILESCASCREIMCLFCTGRGQKDGGDCERCLATGIDPVILEMKKAQATKKAQRLATRFNESLTFFHNLGKPR